MQFGDFRLDIVRESNFKLDGGAMFGVVPKAMWNKLRPADTDNRIQLSCNLLIIQTPQANILVETGMGERWTEQERARFVVEPLTDASAPLSSAGLRNEDIDIVVISHLHFDHAGGAVIERNGKLVPAFPRARYIAQRGEWDFAHNVNARGRASYRLNDFEPLQEHGVLDLIDGDSEIIPGVWARVTGGHTSHHQVICFESQGKKGVYFADIIPTNSHLNPPWVMGYDHYPLASCDVKSEYLTRAADENWLVVFDHETGVPWGHVSKTAQGKFDWHPLPAETLTETALERGHPVRF